MLGEEDQKRQATVGNVRNVKGRRTTNILGGIFPQLQLGGVWRKHVYFYAQFSFLCVVDESLKKTSGFASCVHHNLSVCVCVHMRVHE